MHKNGSYPLAKKSEMFSMDINTAQVLVSEGNFKASLAIMV